MKRFHFQPVLIVLIAFAFTVNAQSPSTTPTASLTPPPPACVAPEFHQFDFWIGHWKVSAEKGEQLGTSEISRVSGGCAVLEQWSTGRSQQGTSVNYYDPSDHQWHQEWVGGGGGILHLHGGLKDKAMAFTDEAPGVKRANMNRITFTPLPDGKVTQEWAVSKDGGKTWQIGFLGIYEKVSD